MKLVNINQNGTLKFQLKTANTFILIIVDMLELKVMIDFTKSIK